MIEINSFDDRFFLVDGINHYRKFFSNVRAGNLIRVYNAYNPIDVLVDYVDFRQIKLDGVIYSDIAQLQIALLEVIFNGEIGTGGGINQNNVPIAIALNYSGEPTEQVLATAVNSLPSFIVSERQIAIFLATNPEQPIELSRKVTFFLKNVGKGTYGQGGTILNGDNILVISVGMPSIYDILPNPRTQIIDLGVITGSVSDVVNALNPPIEVQSQSDGYVVFKATIDVNEANYLFLADGGIYGAGALQTTINDFLLLQGGDNQLGQYELIYNKQSDLTTDLTGEKYPNVGAVKAGLLDLKTQIDALLLVKENKSEKGQNNGYAGLDSIGKVPLANMNDALLGNVKWKGMYNGVVISSSPDSALNGQALPSASNSNTGWYFIATTSFVNSGKNYEVGDWIISNGVTWEKVDNTDSVSSVFGRVGNITAQNGDYTTGQVTEVVNKRYQTDNQNTFNDATSSIQTQLNGKQPLLTNPITGTGALNILPKWSGAQTQVNSSITDDGTNVNISNENLRVTATTPTVSLINSGSSNKRWDTRVNVNDFNITEAGVANHIVVKAGGKTGIGVASPVGALDVFTGITGITIDVPNQATGSLSFVNGGSASPVPTISGKSTTNSGLQLASSANDINSNPDFLLNVRQNTGVDFTTFTSTAFRFARFNTPLIDVLRNGSVGIGSIAPIGKLDIFTGLSGGTFNMATLPNGTISFGNSSTPNTIPTITSKSNDSIGLSVIAGSNDVNTNPDMSFAVRRNDGVDYTVFSTSAFRWTRFTTTLLDLMRDGRMGLGITNPTYNFQINSNNSSSFMQFTSTTSGTTLTDGLIIGVGASNESVFINRENSPTTFSTNNLERVRIHASGAMSIGNQTDAGTGNLNVNGSVSLASQIIRTVPVTSASTFDILTRNVGTGVVEKVDGALLNKPYKIWTGFINQVGTSAPTATVMENTLGGTIVWARTGTGTYSGTLSGAFSSGRTFIMIRTSNGWNGGGNPASLMGANENNSNTFSVHQQRADSVLIDGFGSVPLEIKVYL